MHSPLLLLLLLLLIHTKTQKAKLPDYNPISSFPVDKENDERELEIPRWSPGAMADGDLLMFLRAARSMAAFQGKYPPDEILKSNDTQTSLTPIEYDLY